MVSQWFSQENATSSTKVFFLCVTLFTQKALNMAGVFDTMCIIRGRFYKYLVGKFHVRTI
jgi:hypothetical protein